MIRRILGLRRLRVGWPWLKKYQRRLREVNNSIVWREAWGSKLPPELRYMKCPGCGAEIDLQESPWRREDGPCTDGNYWCLGLLCSHTFGCGCDPEGTGQS